MLFIDDDQAKLRQRREHRGTRTDHHARLAGVSGAPAREAFSVAETRVQHRDRHREPCAEALEELRREADLRHQHQRRAPALERAGGEPQVHLGLAAARYALQQEGAVLIRGRVDRLDRVFLRRAQCGHFRGLRGPLWQGRGCRFAAGCDARGKSGPAALFEGARGGAPAGVRRIKLRDGEARGTGGQESQQLALAGSARWLARRRSRAPSIGGDQPVLLGAR